jgi:hypothetical protein
MGNFALVWMPLEISWPLVEGMRWDRTACPSGSDSVEHVYDINL